MMLRLPFFLALFIFSFGIFTFLERPYYSALPLSALIAYGAAKMLQPESHIRGQRKLQHSEAVELANRKREGEQGIIIGGVELPSNCKNKNFLYIGVPEAGKTLGIKNLMAQGLRDVRDGGNSRGVIYDNKMEFFPFLRGFGVPAEKIYLFHPNDKRSMGWDLQADVRSIKDALDIAKGFAPQVPGEKNPYFTNGTRTLIGSVIQSFYLKAKARETENEARIKEDFAPLPLVKWGMRDVFLALTDEEVMRELFEPYAVTRGALTYLGRENKDLLSTVENSIKPFQALASFWEDQTKISLNDWVKSEEGRVIILGHDHQDSDTSEKLNRVLFRRLGQAILSGPKYGHSRTTWFFLDEFPQMGKLADMQSFIPLMRQFGGTFVLGVQSLADVFDRYGEHVTKTIIELCGTVSVTCCKGDTAKYIAEKIIGTYEFKEKTGSVSQTMENRTITEGEVIRERLAVIESEITQLNYASKKTGIDGFYISSTLNNQVWHRRVMFREIPDALKTADDELGYDPMPEGSKRFEIKDWTPDELKALGLKQEEGKKPPEPEPARKQQQDERDRGPRQRRGGGITWED